MSAPEESLEDRQQDCASTPVGFHESELNDSDVYEVSNCTQDESVLSSEQRGRISTCYMSQNGELPHQMLAPSVSYHVSHAPMSEIPSVTSIDGIEPRQEPPIMVSPSVSAPVQKYVIEVPPGLRKIEQSLLEGSKVMSAEELKEAIVCVQIFEKQADDASIHELVSRLKRLQQQSTRDFCTGVLARCEEIISTQQQQYEPYEHQDRWIYTNVGKDLANPYVGISEYITLCKQNAAKLATMYSTSIQIHNHLRCEALESGSTVWRAVPWDREKALVDGVDGMLAGMSNGGGVSSVDFAEHDALIKKNFQFLYGNINLAVSKLEAVAQLVANEIRGTESSSLKQTSSTGQLKMSSSKNILSTVNVSSNASSHVSNASSNNKTTNAEEQSQVQIDDPSCESLFIKPSWNQDCTCKDMVDCVVEFLVPSVSPCQHCSTLQVKDTLSGEVVSRSSLYEVLSRLDLLELDTRSTVSFIQEDRIESQWKPSNSGVTPKIDLVIDSLQAAQPNLNADLERCMQALQQMTALRMKLESRLEGLMELGRCAEYITYFSKCEASVVNGAANVHNVLGQHQQMQRYRAVLQPLLEFRKLEGQEQYAVTACLDSGKIDNASFLALLPSYTEFLRLEVQRVSKEWTKYGNTLSAVLAWLADRRRNYNGGLRLAFNRYQAQQKVSQFEQVEIMRRKESSTFSEALPVSLRSWSNELSQVCLPSLGELSLDNNTHIVGAHVGSNGVAGGSSNLSMAQQRTRRSGSTTSSNGAHMYGNQTPVLGGTPILGSQDSAVDSPKINSPRNPFSPLSKPATSPVPSPFSLTSSNSQMTSGSHVGFGQASHSMSIPLLSSSGVTATPHSFGSQSYVPSNRTQVSAGVPQNNAMPQARSLMHKHQDE